MGSGIAFLKERHRGAEAAIWRVENAPPAGCFGAVAVALRAMQFQPHITVATVIERDGKFLMVEELIEGEIRYNQPAGHLEAGESLAQAAIRETLEETAWEVRLQAVLGVYQNTNLDTGICYIRTCYIAEPLRQIPELALDEGIVRSLWMSRDEVVDCHQQWRSPLVLTVIDDYLAGNRFPLHSVRHVE
jgi:ADP-ribose pyrophosphatase YjhB (NUDIX family)